MMRHKIENLPTKKKTSVLFCPCMGRPHVKMFHLPSTDALFRRCIMKASVMKRMRQTENVLKRKDISSSKRERYQQKLEYLKALPTISEIK